MNNGDKLTAPAPRLLASTFFRVDDDVGAEVAGLYLALSFGVLPGARIKMKTEHGARLSAHLLAAAARIVTTTSGPR